MKRNRFVLISVLIILILVSLDFEQAVSHRYMRNDETEELMTGETSLIRNELSETATPPRTPKDLRNLVLELTEVTPEANRTDADGDGLYDPVEAVIGTNPSSNDTDHDNVTDYYEVLNGLDPLNPDSNDDGIADYDEINVVLDLDNDDIPNAWDFDNDGDGVNDDPDLSPFACSTVEDYFDIHIQTDGEPTFINIQLVPEKLEHLKLFYQTWDWPDDDEGLMQDHDKSKDDLRIDPLLKISTTSIPNETALAEMNIEATGQEMYVKLTPVVEYETIVALNARILYTDPVPFDINLRAELIWNIFGASDATVNVLKSNDKYLSYGKDMRAICNITDPAYAIPLEMIIISDTELRTKFALKIIGGPFLSVNPATGILAFTGSSIGQYETFLFLNDLGWISGYNGDVFSINTDGTMVLRYSPRPTFELVETVHVSNTDLVKYKEPCRITGITVEEFYGTDMGIFYNSTDINQTMSANWLMTYVFMNNATTTMSDMPTILEEYNITISSSFDTARDKYQALVVLSNELIPGALVGNLHSEFMPIIIALEERCKTLDLSNSLSGTYMMDQSCDFNLVASDLYTTKSMKTNWYNSTTNIVLSPLELCVVVATLDLSEMASVNLLTAILRWNTGIYQVTKVNEILQSFKGPESEELDIVSGVLYGGLEFLNLNGRLIVACRAWEILASYIGNYNRIGLGLDEINARLNLIKKRLGDGVGFLDNVLSLGKSKRWCTWLKHIDTLNMNTNTRFSRFFKCFEKVLFVIGLLVDIGLSIWAGFAIADQIGGQLGRDLGTNYGVIASIMGLLIIALVLIIEQIPLVGWIIALVACIVDAAGGFSARLVEYLTKLFFGTPYTCGTTMPNIRFTDAPDVSIYDFDKNGLDVGDALHVSGSIWNEIEATIKTGLMILTEYLFTQQYLAQFWISASAILSEIRFITADPGAQIWYDPTLQQETIEQHTGDNPYTYKSSTRYTFGAWLSPSVAMINYPVHAIGVTGYYIWHIWKHYPYPWFGINADGCYHFDPFLNITPTYNIVTYSYDIFPNSLAEFLTWGIISPNDPDGDQLTKVEEVQYGLGEWLYDSDGDNLNDKYEIDAGLNPSQSDSDLDGISDWYEHVYGTNATNTDSDEDGVSDYKEISGWIIDFKYLNNDSLVFQIPVTSNPKSNDTDGDLVSDFDEYLGMTNPSSNDTNGDGITDFEAQVRILSESIYESYVDIGDMQEIWDRDPPIPVADIVDDVAVDEEGFVYVSSGGRNYYHGIKKYYPNLTEVTLPSSSYFTPDDSTEIDGITLEIEVDDVNDCLLVWTYRWDWNLILVKYSLDGTAILGTIYSEPVTPAFTTPDLYPSYPIYRCNLDLDENGIVYIPKYQHVRQATNPTGDIQYMPSFMVFNSSGESISNWTYFRTTETHFDNPVAVAVDESRDWVYVGDNGDHGGTTRIAKWTTGGTYIDSFSATFDYIIDIDLDSSGYLYVLGNTSEGYSVRKFDSIGREDIGFKFFGNETLNFTVPEALSIGVNDEIYIVDTIDRTWPATSRIWKFTQVTELECEQLPDTISDWDNDGLTNLQELSGWEITINFTTGQQTFLVTSNPLMNDSDLDGLGDSLEYVLGSNPSSADSDLDGDSDYKEWWVANNPGETYSPPSLRVCINSPSLFPRLSSLAPTGPSITNWDTDGDQLSDSIEASFGSSPINPDSDAEGVSDLNEFLYLSNPNSADSDGDGASDLLELTWNSSLVNADSDSDYIFDGVEYQIGTNPTGNDHDGDGILDGIEQIYGSNPFSNDTDGDGILDAAEVSLWLDILNNDTDGDGVLDGEEIKLGTDPWLIDSDWDGISDSEDPDTTTHWNEEVILVYDADPSNSTLEFAYLLGMYCNVTMVSLTELISNQLDSRYIVLIGAPSDGTYGVGGFVYDLLSDTGTILTEMQEENEFYISVRHGIWTNPQTVVMLSHANVSDAFVVLQTLRFADVSIYPDSVLVEYNVPEIESNASISYAFRVNTIDTIKTLDASVVIQLSSQGTPSILLARYNETTTPQVLSIATGLEDGDVALGRYLDVSITISDTYLDVFESALVLMYYRQEDLDLNGNGYLGDIGDINETTLCFYFYDEQEEKWVKCTEDLDWVISIGQNTTDIEIYGEHYAGYIWVHVTRLSLFAISGQIIMIDYMVYLPVWVTVCILGLIGITFVYRWKTRHSRESRMALDKLLVDDS